MPALRIKADKKRRDPYDPRTGATADDVEPEEDTGADEGVEGNADDGDGNSTEWSKG